MIRTATRASAGLTPGGVKAFIADDAGYRKNGDADFGDE